PGSTGYSGAVASRRESRGGGARACAARRSRTASRTGGTCSRRGRGRRACNGTRRRVRSRDTKAGAGSVSRRRLPEHLVDPLSEPVEALRLRPFDEPRAHYQHVVVRRRKGLEARAPELTQLTLDLRPNDRAAGPLRNRDAQPRVVAVFTRKPVQDEKPARGRPPLPIDGVEIPGAGEAVPALQVVVAWGGGRWG